MQHTLAQLFGTMSDGGGAAAPPRRGAPGALRMAAGAPEPFQRRLS